jgi:HSP20 family protein
MSLINNFIPSLRRASAALADRSELGATRKPLFDIQESEEAYGVSVYLPGVSKDGLEITAEAGVIQIIGRPAWQQPDGWTVLYRESTPVPFELILNHDNAIDADRIAAEVRDGVLRVSLPKAEAFKPRKIAVS